MAVDVTKVMGQNPAYGRPVCPYRFDMDVVVRRATVEDAAGIAAVHVKAWQEAYAHLVPAENLARQKVEQRALRWGEILDEGVRSVFVATDDGAVVGFAGSAARDQDAPRDLELESIYVLENFHGTGAGQLLLDAAVGSAPAFLWVAEDNPRARAFYGRNGFAPDGEWQMHPLAGVPVRVVRLVR